MNNASIYVWDTAQFPELKQGADSNLKQATKDFEKLRQTPVDVISPNIIELGKRISAEAESMSYSDVFMDSYLNAENEIPDQPKFGAVAIPSPDVSQVEAPIPVEQLFNSELLSIIRPMAKELGLVIYDVRGAVYYPDGSIYPPKLAKVVEKQEKLEREISQNAHLYQPNAELPSKRDDFQKLFVPLLSQELTKWGFSLNETKKNFLYFKKKTEFGEITWIFEITGSYGYFIIKYYATILAKQAEKIYTEMREKIDSFKKVEIDAIFMKGSSYKGEKQLGIVKELIPEILDDAKCLLDLKSYADLLVISLEGEKYPSFYPIDSLLLAKLSHNENEYERLITKYPEKIDKKLIEVIDTIIN
ncbi:hypothetical protein [Faucicola atlantae]|uniref:Uncharacterized protein n=1 Tax=Faucicola atlantae TaxID=34059 RepID=A0A1B8QKW9_9GAMM|nr:hypothetical protein [Moraxella atlantae]OBX84231.1 hypothetical protein A9306_03590 [Moraxella atlantae]